MNDYRLDKLTTDDVQSVYSGKPGKCCCGCAGSHRYNSKHAKAASEGRGYPVEGSDVNDKQVAKVLALLQARFQVTGLRYETEEGVVAGDNNFAAEVDGRLYVVYPVKKEKQ